jgi:hypothetical protein
MCSSGGLRTGGADDCAGEAPPRAGESQAPAADYSAYEPRTGLFLSRSAGRLRANLAFTGGTPTSLHAAGDRFNYYIAVVKASERKRPVWAPRLQQRRRQGGHRRSDEMIQDVITQGVARSSCPPR